MMLGSVNWLLIGFLQYDFIAGLFGFQASVFSRIVYILFGVGAVYFAIRIIANKGQAKVFERRKKKQQKQSDAPQNQQISYQNTEASREFSANPKLDNNFNSNTTENFEKPPENSDNLFDEHLHENH